MTYVTKKCPKCGTVYEKQSYPGTPSKQNRKVYGCPLKQCKCCNTQFIDDDYVEIAIEGGKSVNTEKVSTWTIVQVSLGVLFGGITALNGYPFVLPIVILLGGFMVWSEYSDYDKRQKYLEEERIQSELRLQNPVYAALLKSKGYRVPEKYLASLLNKEYQEPVFQKNSNTQQSRDYVRTSTVYQKIPTQCGAAVLAIIFDYYQKPIPMEQLWAEMGNDNRACSAGDIMRIAKLHGFECKGYRREAEELKNTIAPSVIHWNHNHFVVYEGCSYGCVRINDPANGRRELSWNEFVRSYSGVVLEFRI